MHLGYFADFKPSAALLIGADVAALRELGEMFESLAAGRIKKFVIHKLPFVQPHHETELRVSCGSDDRGARRSGAGNIFAWELSRAGWSDAAGRLAALARAPSPCHQVLDAKDDEVVVMVSKGEYDDGWWLEHG